jgi:hypothetical protein
MDEKSNYTKREEGPISQLKNILKEVNMSIYEYELLIWMKNNSNHEFYMDKQQTREQAELKLQASFPEDKDIPSSEGNIIFSRARGEAILS